ncbi:DUF4233 domain-containing protein [Agromyces mangrovi Wang et al. 2018]|uniref:DUF4233 domain-containing protein n=1 Tax=Agromyces mangrovi TaxID=1858653 RepID=UPI002574433B|nr:DUF4233 domain-containing protein [Agromyces mangrovi]BDZ66445.1 hypothetical protein GCM10025877_33830 [Agromyces mangrovi]
MTAAEPGLPEQPDGPAPEPRSIRRSLASIVLGFELFIVLLASLTIFGLSPAPFGDDGIPRWWALVGGGVLLVGLLAIMALLRYEGAYVAGWVLQGILLATGFLNPAMFFVGALFGGMWWYAMVAGARIDRQRKESA